MYYNQIRIIFKPIYWTDVIFIKENTKKERKKDSKKEIISNKFRVRH